MRQAQYRGARQPGAAVARACDRAPAFGCRLAEAGLGRETAIGLQRHAAGKPSRLPAPLARSQRPSRRGSLTRMASDPSRILVISLRRIGDLLLTTPLIRSLRRAWPNATIDVLVFANTAGIVEGNPDINRIIAMPPRPTLGQSAQLLRQLWRQYDIAVSTQSGDRPTAFAFAAAPFRTGVMTDDDPWLARVLKDFVLQKSVRAADKLHRVEQMLRLADVLDVPRIPEL